MMRGHDCQSMGKLLSIMGQRALIVSLKRCSSFLPLRKYVARGFEGNEKNNEDAGNELTDTAKNGQFRVEEEK